MVNEQYSEYGKPASFWLRGFAKMADSMVLLVATFLCFVVLLLWHIAGGNALWILVPLALAPTVGWIAYLAYYTSAGRQTFGYRLAGIKASNVDGSDIKSAHAVTRSLIGTLCYAIASNWLGLLIYLPIVINASKRGLNDLAAGTLVKRVAPPRKGPLALFAVASYVLPVMVIFSVIMPFTVRAYYLPSGAMQPTLMKNDHVLVNELYYRIRGPRSGDIVVFKSPPSATYNGKEETFIKRVIGLPGDIIEISSGVGVFRNGKLLNEPYVAEVPMYDMKPFTVPKHKLFVMGDNRNNSNDSHMWGPLEQNRLIGKAMFRFWPISRAANL